jgi:hypothetical protein
MRLVPFTRIGPTRARDPAQLRVTHPPRSFSPHLPRLPSWSPIGGGPCSLRPSPSHWRQRRASLSGEQRREKAALGGGAAGRGQGRHERRTRPLLRHGRTADHVHCCLHADVVVALSVCEDVVSALSPRSMVRRARAMVAGSSGYSLGGEDGRLLPYGKQA